MRTSSLLITISVSLLWVVSSHASQVLWGSARLANNYLSAGPPSAMDAGFTFQLGAFDEGFTPTPENVADWLDHWTPAQGRTYNDTTRFFTGSFVYQQNVTPFMPSNQAYIFGFNRWATSEGGSQAEWILATNPAWKWPAGGGISPPVQWSMSSASEIVLGSVNAPSGNAHMQTESVPTPVASLSDDLRAKRYLDLEDPGASGGQEDPDHDGLSTALELAFGLDPETPNQGRYPNTEIVYDSGQAYVEISFLKLGQQADVTLGLQVSDDLESWQNDTVTVVEDSLLIYRARASKPIHLTSGEHRYYRLAVNP